MALILEFIIIILQNCPRDVKSIHKTVLHFWHGISAWKTKKKKLYAYLISTLNSAEWLASTAEKNGAQLGLRPVLGPCQHTYSSKTLTAQLTACHFTD